MASGGQQTLHPDVPLSCRPVAAGGQNASFIGVPDRPVYGLGVTGEGEKLFPAFGVTDPRSVIVAGCQDLHRHLW